MQLKKRDKYKQLVVIKLAPVGPTKRPNNPAINDPARGKITIQRYIFFYAGVVGGKRSRNPYEVRIPNLRLRRSRLWGELGA